MSQKINIEVLEKNLNREYDEIFTIHKNIKFLSKLIKESKPESQIINNIMSIKSNINNNILQLEVNIVDKKEIGRISKKYNKLSKLIEKIEEWYKIASGGDEFTIDIEKGLKSKSFVKNKKTIINTLKKYEEYEKKETIKSIQNNVIRIWINQNLYIDVNLN